jgi:hypothetical protein
MAATSSIDRKTSGFQRWDAKTGAPRRSREFVYLESRELGRCLQRGLDP